MIVQSHPELARKIGERLTALVQAGGETQRELEHKTGVTLSVLNTAIKGKGVPSTYALIRIARHYGVTVDWLVGESERKSRPKPRPKAKAV